MCRLTCIALLATATLALAQPARDVYPPGTVFRSLPPISVAPIVPVESRLLSLPAVQSDLELTAEQKRALENVEKQQSTPVGAISLGIFGWLDLETAQAIQTLARVNFFNKTLTKAQRTRLRQIEYQLKEREFGAYAALAMAAKDLGLRADQLEDVTSIKGQRVEDIAKLVTSGERFEKVKTKVVATNGDTYEKMAEMLTRTQRERLKELKGKVFGGKVDLMHAPGIGEKGGLTPSAKGPKLPFYPKEFFGVYEFEVRYFSSGTVRAELEISNDQLRSIIAALDDWNSRFENLEGKHPERAAALHEKSAKIIDSILIPQQRTRFDQLMAQRRGIIGGLEAVCGYPAVVAELKISPNQLRQLKEGESVKSVLTESQYRGLDRLLGAKFDFGLVAVADPVLKQFSERQGEAAARKFANESVQGWSAFARHFLVISDRLKLSDDQIKKLRELAEDEPKFFELIQRELSFADSPPVTGAGRGVTPAGVVSEQFREAIEEQCWNVLDERQQSTAKQIYGRRK